MSRFLYTTLLLLLAPLIPLYLLWRARRQPEYRQHWGERCGLYPALPPSPTRPILWLHAVSVGETRASQPLIQHLRQHWPQHRILLTHMTPTGRQTAFDLYGDSILHAYLPYDWPWAVHAFLQHFQPVAGILMETELWPNLVATCQQRRIPLLLVNARLSEKSARRYARLPALTRPMLQALTAIAAQSPDDAARLQTLGARETQLHVCGNLKFDISPPAAQLSLGQSWRKQWSPRQVLLLASTRDGEEALILDAWCRQQQCDTDRDTHPMRPLLLIVPRHPQRFDSVARLVEERGLRLARRSHTTTPDARIDVLLGDSMGEMFAYYAASDAAFIGGSLLDYGCQNLIEACATGIPVLIGPSTYNFTEAAQAALACGAACRITDAGHLVREAFRLLEDEAQQARAGTAGKTLVAQHQGASTRTLSLLERTLPEPLAR